VGKSSLAIELALRVNGEIVGADAFQVYRGLELLTAQPTAEQRASVRHHLVGTWPLEEACDAARWAVAARVCLADIASRGRRPILVGGTGMYLKALTHGLADLPPVDQALRARVSAMELPEAIARLREADIEAPEQIDLRNPARVRRALEIVLSTGQPLASHRQAWQKQGDSGFDGVLLVRDREELRRRIAANVDAMFAAGVVDEVRLALLSAGPGASRAIGFEEVRRLIAGEISEPECRAAILMATRRYAKRQLTWCRNQFSFPIIDLTATPDPIESLILPMETSKE